jgi:glycosyltransferase involved in cell wall biosynthesis
MAGSLSRRMTGTDEPVSVVVPAFNAERTIDETLLSIRAQTHENLDIIVVDDGSTDRTCELARKHSLIDGRVRVVRQLNQGVAAARNRGIAEARAEIIAPIDADDLWRSTKVSRQLQVMRESDPRVELVYAWSAYIDECGKIVSLDRRPSFSGDVLSVLCCGNFVGNGSTALMRKSVLQRLGGYDQSLRAREAQGCEDWSLFLRIARVGQFALVPDYLTGYRQVPNAMSRNVDQMLKSDALVRAESLLLYPECEEEIRSGRLSYIEWMFQRELRAGKWASCLALLQRVFAKDDTGPGSLWRSTKSALRIGARCIVANPFLSRRSRYPELMTFVAQHDRGVALNGDVNDD